MSILQLKTQVAARRYVVDPDAVALAMLRHHSHLVLEPSELHLGTLVPEREPGDPGDDVTDPGHPVDGGT